MQPWYSFLYAYGVGGILFATPIVLAIKKGALRPAVPAERRVLIGLIVVYLAYALGQGTWTYLALQGGAS